MKTYRGWICAEECDRPVLESLGVEMGCYEEMMGTFENCVVGEAAYEVLQSHWGRFVWHLMVEECASEERASEQCPFLECAPCAPIEVPMAEMCNVSNSL